MNLPEASDVWTLCSGQLIVWTKQAGLSLAQPCSTPSVSVIFISWAHFTPSVLLNSDAFTVSAPSFSIMSSTLKNNYTEQQLHTVKRLETVFEAVLSGSLMQRFNVDYYHESPPIRLTDAYIQGKNHEHDHGCSLLKDFTKYLLISNIFNSEVYSALFSTFTSNSLAMYGDLTHLLLLCNHSTNN